nr:hypothetical protein [Ferrimicrobium acidiphilum]
MIDVLLAARLFMAASFVLAGVQDMKERAISDFVWFPGIAGGIMSIYWCYANLPGTLFYIEIFKFGMFSAIGVVFVLLGYAGQADAIAMMVIGADPYLLSFLALVVAAAVAAGHLVGVYRKGFLKGGLSIPIEQFKAQKQWLPMMIVNAGQTIDITQDVNISREDVMSKAPPGSTVLVQYGLPVVTYIAIGYIAYLVASILIFAGGALA